MVEENDIKEYLERLDARILGLDGEVSSFKIQRIGLGESNLNYLAVVNDRKFNVRINMDPNSPGKSRKEYVSLRIVEPLEIAPKVYHFEPSKKYLGETFIILEYLEGKPLDKYGKTGDAIVRKLAKVTADLHNTDFKGIEWDMKKKRSSKTYILKEIKRRIDYIKGKRKKYFPQKREFENALAGSYRKLQSLRFPKKSRYVLGHGDIAPQNVILSRGRLRLIDWEDMDLIDPALEIAIIYDSFDFSDGQKEAFLQEYLKARKEPELERRIQLFWPFQLFGVFCWSIMHVYEIGEEEMHGDFLKEQNLKEHIAYAHRMFQKCRKEGIVGRDLKWHVSEVFPDFTGISLAR